MTPYYEQDGIAIYQADCRDVLPSLSPMDILFTSPPYMQQRTYGGSVIDWNALVPEALGAARLSPDGQMFVNLGLVYQNGELVEYWRPLFWRLQVAGYRLFGWYVWDQGFGLPGDWNGRFAPSHEFVFHFNRAARQPNKTVSTNLRKFSGGGLRTVDGTVKPKSSPELCGQPTKVPDSVVRVYREMHRDVDHPALFPIEFPLAILAAFDGAVIDPFMGSGTTLVAAKRLGRKAIGIDINEQYCEIAATRLSQGVLTLEQPA